MLVLTRKGEEAVRLLDKVSGQVTWVRVLDIRQETVRLGFDAPDNVEILRGELTEDTEQQLPKAAVDGSCPVCKDAWTVEVPRHGFTEWKGGALIQKALPNISLSEREMLISGTCESCFSKMFDCGLEEVPDASA
jgi:carbon storage regulator CsrA